MVWKSRWKLTPRSSPRAPTASNHRGMKLAWGSRVDLRDGFAVAQHADDLSRVHQVEVPLGLIAQFGEGGVSHVHLYGE